MSFFGSIFGSNSFLGVDIGTSSIKAAEIIKATNGLRLKNYGVLETYGHLERLNNAIQTSSLKMLEKETAELVRNLVKELNIRAREVVASLPNFLAFTTLLELPEMSETDVAKTVGFQARQYIPIPISEVTIDWIKVGESEDDQGTKVQQIFLISVPNDHIKRYKHIFKSVGLKLVSLEIESLSLARSLINGDKTPTLVVDIGARSTAITVVDQSRVKYTGQTDFASNSLTQAVSSGLHINTRRAEILKKQQGLLGAGGEYELSTLIQPFLDAIIEETKRVKNIYETDYEGRIEKVLLSGGGANLLGLEKYFSDQIGLPVSKGNPFARILYPPEIEPVIGELGGVFSVAIGLGIREFVKREY